MGRASTFNENPRVKRRSALHSRIWVPFEPSWKQLEPTCVQLGVYLSQLGANLVELGAMLGQLDAILDTENMTNHRFSFVFQAFLQCRSSCTLEAMLGEIVSNCEPLEVNLGSIWVVLDLTLPIFGPAGTYLGVYLHPLGLH